MSMIEDDDFVILPPKAPGGKYTMRFAKRKPGVPLIDPPQVCVACDTEKPSHAFLPIDGGHSLLCSNCRHLPRSHIRPLPWDHDVRWRDRVLYEESQTALRLLELGIDHAKRTAITR